MFCNFRVSTLFQLICQGNIFNFHSEHLGRVICKVEMTRNKLCFWIHWTIPRWMIHLKEPTQIKSQLFVIQTETESSPQLKKTTLTKNK